MPFHFYVSSSMRTLRFCTIFTSNKHLQTFGQVRVMSGDWKPQFWCFSWVEQSNLALKRVVKCQQKYGCKKDRDQSHYKPCWSRYFGKSWLQLALGSENFHTVDASELPRGFSHLGCFFFNPVKIMGFQLATSLKMGELKPEFWLPSSTRIFQRAALFYPPT